MPRSAGCRLWHACRAACMAFGSAPARSVVDGRVPGGRVPGGRLEDGAPATVVSVRGGRSGTSTPWSRRQAVYAAPGSVVVEASATAATGVGDALPEPPQATVATQSVAPNTNSDRCPVPAPMAGDQS